MLARYDNVYAGLGRILLGLYFVVPGIRQNCWLRRHSRAHAD